MEEGPGVAAEGTGVGRAFDLGDEGGVGAGSFGALSGKAGEGGEVVAGLERGVVGQSERMTKRRRDGLLCRACRLARGPSLAAAVSFRPSGVSVPS